MESQISPTPEVVSPLSPFEDILSWIPYIAAGIIGIWSAAIIARITSAKPVPIVQQKQSRTSQKHSSDTTASNTEMAAPIGLMSSDSTGPTEPPGDRVFTSAELAQYNGTDASNPVYLAIKGTVFDVSKSREMYVPGKGYHVFAGKDASRALGKSSLKVEDCVADYSGLTEDEMKTLDKWEGHYRKKYNIVGKVVGE